MNAHFPSGHYILIVKSYVFTYIPLFVATVEISPQHVPDIEVWPPCMSTSHVLDIFTENYYEELLIHLILLDIELYFIKDSEDQ